MNVRDPIIRTPLHHSPELLSGDDTGYRNVPSHEGNEPMVPLQNNKNIIIRPVYAGHNAINGQINTASSLPGTGELMYTRQAVAHCLEQAAAFIAEQSEYRLIAVDGFRNFQTQAAGFSRLFMESLGGDRSDTAKYDALLSADGIFSFVDIDMAQVENSPLTIADCVRLATKVNGDPTPEQIRKEILTGEANVALYQRLIGQDTGLIDMGGVLARKTGHLWERFISF